MYPSSSRNTHSRGPRRSGGGRSSGGYRGGQRGGYAGRQGYGGGRGGSRGRANRPGANVHFSRFIQKAETPEETVAYVPKHAFIDFAIDERLKRNISRKGYVTPTPIQDEAIPSVLEGRDIVGLAETGTGKTGAFLVPLIDKVLKDPAESVLIMAPTRELAVQIAEEFRGFATGTGLRAAIAVGGANINEQIRSLRAGAQFLIGTPGRLIDLVERGDLELSRCSNVVLDEADRMLDMGFIDNMRYIIGELPKKRQTLFFSATLSKEIETIIHEFLHEPVRVSVKTRDTSKNVDQDVVHIAPGRNKFDHLVELLRDGAFTKVLVFGRTKHGVERLLKMLAQAGIRAASIHGNKSHNQRLRALDEFKRERVQVLVATDVAARGLDIPNVSHVINYDAPNTFEDYVHRIGRTGRAGGKGKALTFIEAHERA